MKRKTTSLFFTLLVPISLCTILFLITASAMLATIYMRQTTQSSIQSNLEILNQTATSLELLHNHIAKVATDISQKSYLNIILETPLSGGTQEWNGRQKLASLFTSSPSAMVDYETTIIGTNGIAVSSGNGGVTLDVDEIMALPVFKNALASGYIAYDCQPTGLSYATQHAPVILGCKALKNSDGTVIGTVLISIKEHSLRQFYQSFLSKSTNITLLSDNGTVLSSSIPNEAGTKNEYLLTLAQANRAQSKTYIQTKADGIVLSHYVSYYDAYIISQITPSVLFQNFFPNTRTILIILFALLCLIISVTWIIHCNLRPLKQLADHMASSETVPTPLSVARTSSTEMERITDAYDKMIHTLNTYLNELSTAHEKQRKDELELLQMQINPHFLYNTLDSVKHMVGMHNSNDACATIDSLISLLRSTLSKTNTMVSIKSEVTNAQNYITIIEPRYGGLIHAEINANEDCYSYQIPNLLLQPLIENAFFHAFQNEKKGSISVLISVQAGEVSCDIIDNGDGMDSEQLSQIDENSHARQSATRIGIANVRERLFMLYPNQSTFQITSELHFGTCIHFSYPAINFQINA